MAASSDDSENISDLVASRSSSTSSLNGPRSFAYAAVERANLLNLSKLCIKNLIESSLKSGRNLGEDHLPLQQFFVIIEHVLRHGLKVKRNFLGASKDYWGPLENIEKIDADAAEITESVRSLPGLKTGLGRGRAWLRLAMMQKKIADYLNSLLTRKDILSEWYEQSATMIGEEGAVIGGLLVGLNVIDCNMCIKGGDLDLQRSVIDLSFYLKEGNYLEKPDDDCSTSTNNESQNVNMELVLDQKAYLEEINRSLASNMADLQAKMKILEDLDKTQKEEIGNLKYELKSVVEERDELKKGSDVVVLQHKRQLEIVQADIGIERETYVKSREGLNEMYEDVRKQLDNEKKLRKETESELELVKNMKNESQIAMQLLEKDIHDKQDTLISLRRQLQDIKTINLDLHTKWQESQTAKAQNEEKWAELGEKYSRITIESKDLENKLNEVCKEKSAVEETMQQISQQLVTCDGKRNALEVDLKIERDWRSGLQEELTRVNENLTQMEGRVRELEVVKQKYATLEEAHNELKKSYLEQETALVEMGNTLSSSHLKVVEMKEAHQNMKEMKWTDDKDTAYCQFCKQAFSISRRKHHCRNCGGIFCNSCSDNAMPLPSSAKPVRVCDICYNTLLERYQS
ncbi:RUN and FYVE domain-containing protein 2-like [Dendronephthya gigantea]|uniref:RUN and FYVE domain-containing protein 2-like n=1 Tax=Dendronephthya gigantea TaxID=151771 RepID=UPI0010693B37|nr:RUN and FYVE domain-containing protein 2-like [Dendronephthya gigantea]